MGSFRSLVHSVNRPAILVVLQEQNEVQCKNKEKLSAVVPVEFVTSLHCYIVIESGFIMSECCQLEEVMTKLF